MTTSPSYAYAPMPSLTLCYAYGLIALCVIVYAYIPIPIHSYQLHHQSFPLLAGRREPGGPAQHGQPSEPGSSRDENLS